MVRVVDNFPGHLKEERVKAIKTEIVAHSFHKFIFEGDEKGIATKGAW